MLTVIPNHSVLESAKFVWLVILKFQLMKKCSHCSHPPVPTISTLNDADALLKVLMREVLLPYANWRASLAYLGPEGPHAGGVTPQTPQLTARSR